MKAIETVTTATLSLAAIQVAPVVAQATANAVELPITDIIQIFMQVVTGVATLYKLFFHKTNLNNEKNV